MNRFIWSIAFVLGYIVSYSSGYSTTTVSCSVISVSSPQGKKEHVSLQSHHHSDVKIKFKKKRIRDTAQVILFCPEQDLEYTYFSRSYRSLKTQLLSSPLNLRENVRRGPPVLFS